MIEAYSPEQFVDRLKDVFLCPGALGYIVFDDNVGDDQFLRATIEWSLDNGILKEDKAKTRLLYDQVYRLTVKGKDAIGIKVRKQKEKTMTSEEFKEYIESSTIEGDFVRIDTLSRESGLKHETFCAMLEALVGSEPRWHLGAGGSVRKGERYLYGFSSAYRFLMKVSNGS